MIKIGITGNIASGKSEFENILKKKNFLVYDLDDIVNYLYQNDNNIKEKILNEFNSLDKKTIANIVFNDDKKRIILEGIIYPNLKEIILDIFKKNKNKQAIFISGALLFESGLYELFDKIIFIDAPYDIRLNRLKKRNNFDETEAKKRMDIQKNTSKSKSDFVILNDKTIIDLEIETTKVLDKIFNC